FAAIGAAAPLPDPGPGSGTPPPKLDYSKPIQFDVQFAPVTFPKDAPKDVRSNPMPLIIGGYLENGKVTGAYAPDISYVYFPGGCPDDVEWALYPFGPRRESGARGDRNVQREKFASASLRLNGNQFEGAWTLRFVSSKEPSKALSPDYALSIKAAAKGSGFAGTYTGKVVQPESKAALLAVQLRATQRACWQTRPPRRPPHPSWKAQKISGSPTGRPNSRPTPPAPRSPYAWTPPPAEFSIAGQISMARFPTTLRKHSPSPWMNTSGCISSTKTHRQNNGLSLASMQEMIHETRFDRQHPV
ncbi:MAG: hypothetical protein WCJ97_08055, partial [Phycisphaerae bacterium]